LRSNYVYNVVDYYLATHKNFRENGKFFGEFKAVTIQPIVEGVKGRVDYIRRNDVIEKRE